MTIRPDVQFRSGFPDDTVDDGHDIVAYPGRNIAEALKAALEPLGYQVSEPICLEHAGWELDIGRQRKSFCVRISLVDADECYLMADSNTSWFWPDVKGFRVFLADLQRVLSDDSRFTLVGWFPRGVSTGGADTPFDP